MELEGKEGCGRCSASSIVCFEIGDTHRASSRLDVGHLPDSRLGWNNA